MKKFLVFLLLISGLDLAIAQTDYEPFANATAYGGSPYTVGSLFCSGFSGANLVEATNATGGVWGCVSNEAGAAVQGLPVITNGNLSYPGLGTSTGNSLYLPPYTGNMGRLTLPFQVNNSGQAYYSFLLKVTDVSTLSSNNTANFFIGFQDGTGPQRAAVARAQAYVSATHSGSGYVLGLGKNTPTVGHTVYDTNNVRNVGDTLFIVVSYDYTATGHPATMWVNPDPSTFGAATPPATFTLQTTNGAGELQANGISALVLGCFTAPPPACVVDDLRVAETWALVTGAPNIQIPPSPLTTNAGTTATFTVFATGALLNYQWLRGGTPLTDGGNVSGSTNATLSISDCSLNDADNYSVIVSNGYGAVTSSIASLSVNDPYVDVPPADQTLAPGSTAVFYVVAGGVPTLTYGWLKNGHPLTDGGNISGSQTATLTISDISFLDAAAYSVSVTNGLGSFVQSSPASLAITDPAILGQPESVTNNYGDTATFSVQADGQTTLNYHWQETGVGALSDGNGISGSGTSVLTISGVSYLNAGSYYCLVSDSNGSTNSASASLTVIEPIITSEPVSTTVAQGSTATFNVSANGAPTLTYQWSFNGTAYGGDTGNVSGTQTSTLTISSAAAGNAGTYTVKVTDASGMSEQSTAATLAVLTAPSITVQPSALTVAAGNNATFAVGANGAATLIYDWLSNGVSVASSTNFAYTVTNAQVGMGASYSVIVSNSLGTATSSVVPLGVVSNIHLYSTNLVVVRVGNGAEPQDYTGASVFLDQFTTAGTYLNTVCIPDTGTNALVEIAPDVNGTTITGTALSVSGDGLEMVLSGYNTPRPYSGTLFTSTASAVPRGVGMVNSAGNYVLAATSRSAFSATYYRGAASDGTNNFWGAGNTGGTYYFGDSDAATNVQSDYPNLRSTSIFNGNLYAISGSSSGLAVLEWNGLPTNAAEPALLFVPGATPTDMALDPTGTNIMYLGTSLGIMRYQFNGSYWSLQYTITGNAIRYLTADFSQNPPVIYATTSDSATDRILAVVDQGLGSSETVIATAGVNQNFRGIRFGPGEPYFNFSSAPGNIILNWDGYYTLQASTNVASGYTDVPDATPPYTNAFTNAQELFFHLRQ